MALIPPFSLDCVVAIGIPRNGAESSWIASGFVYGRFVRESEGNESEYRVYLVTNRHVFGELDRVVLRFNPQANQPAKEYTADLKDSSGKLLWFGHPDHEVDVAVLPINYKLLHSEAMQVSAFLSNKHVAGLDKLTELGTTEGDGVFLLGFPMGLIGGERNFVIARGGSLARVRDALARASKTFLVDALVFPGNSGGPVISRPEVIAIQGTRAQSSSYLIGLVSSYVPYQDVAISQQTNRPRVIFEENSGLVAVHPVDFIEDCITTHESSVTLEPLEEQTEPVPVQ